MRKICLAYWTLLTLLLLASNPFDLLGLEPSDGGVLQWYGDWSHLISFGVLSTLVFLARWPWTRRRLMIALIAYSAGTELLQLLVPTRHAEWKDFVQDAAGVALGFCLAWLCRRVWHAESMSRAENRIAWQRPRRRDASLAASTPPEC
jgi:hypothetical protein